MKETLIAILIFFSLAAGFTEAAAARLPVEEQRINRLIAAIETLPGAQFIRNDTAYDGKAAADHLRLKLKAAEAKVKTAEDFIRLCASRSSMTGKPYRIRFADGTLCEAEAFFLETLQADRM